MTIIANSKQQRNFISFPIPEEDDRITCAVGVAEAIVVDGVVFREYPDGRRERVNKQSPA